MQSGDVVAQKFRLTRELGSGGMGTVWEAQQLDLRRRVALKVLTDPSKPTALARFEREARVMARLAHPKAVGVYEFGEVDGVAFIAMELVEGKSLGDFIEVTGALSIEMSAKVIVDLCEVLSAAHALGIVHRDLKPSNVMIELREGVLFARVVDFGIALLGLHDDIQSTRITRTGQIAGTATYLSPEQCRAQPSDGRSDLYQLGCIFYELLTGQPPFTSASSAELMTAHLYRTPAAPSQVAPAQNISPALDEVVLWLLRKRPEDRPATAQETIALIAEALANPRGDRTQTSRTPVPMTESYPAVWPMAEPTDAAVAFIRVAGDRHAAECDMLLNALAASGLTVLQDNPPDVGRCGAMLVLANDAIEGLALCTPWVDRCAVLLCGSEDDVSGMTQAISRGVFDWVPMPLEPADAVRRVLRALRRKKTR